MPAPHGLIERLAELAATGHPFVLVTLVETVGSTPQDVGTKMLVDASGLQLGVAGTGFGPIAVRYSAPALPGGSENEYETAVAALGDFLRSPARIAGAWQFIGVQWIGGKLETSTTLVEENRWVCEFSLLSYVKVV
jgi:hypothetical protein